MVEERVSNLTKEFLTKANLSADDKKVFDKEFAELTE
jgi:hypothetical protein